MAETKYWTGGAGNGDAGTTGNWHTGNVIANGDTFIWGEGDTNIIAFTGCSALTGVLVIVSSNYRGSFGTSSAALSYSSIASLNYAGKGAFANFGCGGTVTTATFGHSPGSTVNLSSGTWTAIVNSLGPLNIEAATVVTTCRNLGSLNAAYNATGFTTLILANASTAYIYRNSATTKIKTGSTLTQADSGVAAFTSAGTTLCEIESGATFRKLSGGTETLTEVFPGGKLSLSGNSGGTTGAITFTTINKWAGAVLQIYNVPGITVTITNPIVPYGSSSGGGEGEIG